MNPNPQDLEGRLADVPILAGLSQRQRSKLVDGAKLVEHPDGREVAAEGEGSLALHVIVSGTATVTVQGREVRTLGEGDYFGEISLIDGKPRSATVTASGSLQTVAVPHLTFQKVLLDDPEAVQHLLVILCARLREAEAAD